MRILLKIIRWAIGFFFGSTILAVIIYRYMPVYVTPLMVIRSIEHISDGKSVIWHHHWIPLEEMSRHLPVAAMAGEDLKYLSHHGFNFESIKGAIKKNAANGKIQRGGSTISQQTAKNVFLWPSRTWVRKGFEAYFTVLIELFWSKQRIMEVYLNSIEMGDGIYGVDAVAEYHFGKKAIDLTRSECALIVATLPNPRLYNSMIPSAYTRRQQRKIEREMKFIPSFPKEGEAIDPHTAKGTYYK
ncbi:MAG: monofunctional biosynthetic peptidoglycan transglycosylase [Prevotella sp.]|jgi:monofunctional biosynthetic peptidoglycan transglycosylase|nr:monofunctional biosynthetic peptidoglycan transglycosylase [Prevotella sp.]